MPGLLEVISILEKYPITRESLEVGVVQGSATFDHTYHCFVYEFNTDTTMNTLLYQNSLPQ